MICVLSTYEYFINDKKPKIHDSRCCSLKMYLSLAYKILFSKIKSKSFASFWVFIITMTDNTENLPLTS